MHFSKYPNSKAWFQILFLSHWSIQFDLLPKLTHKSVVFWSKITVCFGSPCINGIILPVYRILLQSATYKIFNHTKHLHTAAEIVLKRLCQHQLPSCIIIMKTYYFIMFIMCLQNCTWNKQLVLAIITSTLEWLSKFRIHNSIKLHRM